MNTKITEAEKRKNGMKIMIIALMVGMIIGGTFKLLKLPVPVPHDFSGIVGLIGMFIGSALIDLILQWLSK